ncbi:hypothetical protein AB833_09875 [Chromatiales bacterium (ex Bugula neritina AB1)]|nr:hypothetical protein AB833_09875 [Chromatiales bacterium (ex Bugula neritina AB1)]
MSRTTTLNRLERLELLTSRLKASGPIVLSDIADEFGISLRSIGRDIQVLRERGVPIEADRGRGGGVRLNPDWGVGRITLTQQEAINLLIGVAVTEKMGSSILMQDTSSIQRKVTASFSRDNQRKIKHLRDRIRIGSASSIEVLSSFGSVPKAINDGLQESFILMRRAIIEYRSGDRKITRRLIEPHYLVLNFPVWYMLCWDDLRTDTRTFRLDRIRSLAICSETFKLLPYSDFEESMKGNEVVSP